MIVSSVKGLRDPFVLVEGDTYYLYGTGVAQAADWDNTAWVCYVNDSGRLDGEWRPVPLPYHLPPDAQKNFWAPEVHRYNGAYYLFGTYYSSATGRRGSAVLKSSCPTGPFTPISVGHITPKEWDAIDATLYVDKDGQPWMVFVHEWVCTEDGVGRMCAARLSADLSHMISPPVELFRADAPPWTDRAVTDGCFLYTTAAGDLLMTWSNFDEDGYVVAVAHSQNGRPDGAWTHEAAPLYKRGTVDGHDGGHGMVFTALDGQLYLCLHSPNQPCDACRERTVFVPLREENATLSLCR